MKFCRFFNIRNQFIQSYALRNYRQINTLCHIVFIALRNMKLYDSFHKHSIVYLIKIAIRYLPKLYNLLISSPESARLAPLEVANACVRVLLLTGVIEGDIVGRAATQIYLDSLRLFLLLFK